MTPLTHLWQAETCFLQWFELHFLPMFTTNEKAFSLLVQVHIYVSNHIKKPFDISVFFLGSEWHMSRTWLLRHS